MSLMDQIRAKAAERETSRPKLTTADINIRGSGLTKREAEKNTREYERQADKSIKSADAKSVAETEERFSRGIEETLAAMQRENAKSAIQYDSSQLTALSGILKNKVCCLIGAAGTGKTTITREVVLQLAKICKVVKLDATTFVTCESEDGNKFRCLSKTAWEQKYKIVDDTKIKDAEIPGIAIAAYTGRASQQTKRAIPEEWWQNVSTIHRLLGYAPTFEDVEYQDPITGEMGWKTRKVFRPSFDASCKLPFTFYVFDESSMIPISLWNELIAAMPPEARILCIGDIHQLPPPYGKGVLGYCLRKWPVFELTQIHRQAAGNPIIANAHRILNGKPLENAKNFHLIGNDGRNAKVAPSGMSDLSAYFLGVIKNLADLKGKDGQPLYDPLKDNIIVPSNKNLVGTDFLNEKLVTMFNPEIKENGIVVNKRMKIHTGNNFVYYALRDKIMITKNINTVEPPITNGMLGIVEAINLNGRYDQKRTQIEDDDGGSFDMDEPLDLNLDSMNLNFALEGEEKDEKKEDESSDQRQASHVMVIRFENGQTYECSTAGDYRAVKHGYATTCHKAQGGEYPNVIILCHSVNAVQLTQEWLYTAVTRARNNVYIVCNQRGLSQALGRQTIKGYTLKDKIAAYALENKIEETDFFDPMKHPILWEPKEI